ncbi:MAG: TonB-dependent receptor, partial [Gammaproteobacteria bacterium]|nr:TonB-dependent receptor [Gammaproteobacteria bacterium]
RTGDIADAVVPGATISFYTNAIDTLSQGVDVVLTSDLEWSENASTQLSFAFNYNDFEVTGQKVIDTPNGPFTPVSDSTVEDIENNYPGTRFVATANTFFGENWNFMARANYYGSHFDERGRIGTGDGSSAEIGATIYFDVELGYQVTENFKLAAGAVNLFDSFIDEIGEPNANRLSVGLQYPRRSAANYEGGSWYVKGTFTF